MEGRHGFENKRLLFQGLSISAREEGSPNTRSKLTVRHGGGLNHPSPVYNERGGWSWPSSISSGRIKGLPDIPPRSAAPSACSWTTLAPTTRLSSRTTPILIGLSTTPRGQSSGLNPPPSRKRNNHTHFNVTHIALLTISSIRSLIASSNCSG